MGGLKVKVMKIIKYWDTLDKAKTNQIELELKVSFILKLKIESEILWEDYYNLPEDMNVKDKEEDKLTGRNRGKT